MKREGGGGEREREGRFDDYTRENIDEYMGKKTNPATSGVRAYPGLQPELTPPGYCRRRTLRVRSVRRASGTYRFFGNLFVTSPKLVVAREGPVFEGRERKVRLAAFTVHIKPR
jgi:hypothetical protein